jgi:hypothetical protein
LAQANVEFCRARGWTLVEIYVDPGRAGALVARPALQRLLKDAAQGKFDVLVVHPIEQAAVQLAFTCYATGEYSDEQIARLLNEYRNGTGVEFRTKGRRGRCGPGLFNKDSIRDLLQNVHYTGQVPYYGPTNGDRRKRDPVALYPGQHPALVDQALFDRCQEIRALMSSHPRKAQDYISKLYLLSGLLYCAQCHRPMRAQAAHGVRQYQDKTRTLHTGDCDQETVNAHEDEEQVARYLMSFHLPPNWRDEILTGLCSPGNGRRWRRRSRSSRGGWRGWWSST